MSSSIYTLKIDIDDSKIRDIEKRLMGIVNGGDSSTGLGSKVLGASGGQKNDMMKNIGKLGMIATGVLAVVGILQKLSSMVIQSSPMLQQMLKLLNFGIMLILRPIGDFFGFFLRPIVLYFLRNIAIPWFQMARPIMQSMGTKAGTAFARDPVGSLAGSGLLGVVPLIITKRDEIITTVEGYFLKWSLAIQKWIDGFKLPSLHELMMSIKKWTVQQINGLPDFAGRITAYIRRWIARITPRLPVWDFSAVTEWMKGIKLPTWDDLNTTMNTVKSTIKDIIDSVLGFFQNILNWIIGSDKNEKEKSQTTVQPVVVFGDANGDGKFNLDDLMFQISDFTKGGNQ